jgi:cytochrome c
VHSWCVDFTVSGRRVGVEAGDAARGERAFQRCYSCHSVDPNEAAKLEGPTLYRIMERRAAAVPSFVYPDAMRERGAAGIVWDAGTAQTIVVGQLSWHKAQQRNKRAKSSS